MRKVLVLLALSIATAACGRGGSSESEGTRVPAVGAAPFAIVASSDLAVGEDRILVALRSATGSPIGGPALPVTLRLYPADDPAQVTSIAASFLWMVPDVTGLYRATVELDRPGLWMLEAEVGGSESLTIEATTFVVGETHKTVAVGEPAPRSATPTAADFPLEAITTDPEPDPAFYSLSLADAVDSGRSTVVVFATPAFCQTAACGPMLDQVKAVAGEWPGVNWVHVEVFTNLDQVNDLEHVPAVAEWRLPTEPWVFVTDDAGIVRARFEGAVDPAEIEAVLLMLQ